MIRIERFSANSAKSAKLRELMAIFYKSILSHSTLAFIYKNVFEIISLSKYDDRLRTGLVPL